MEQAVPVDSTLFGEDPQADPSQLFEKDANVSLPPRNQDELAAQLALANDKDTNLPFDERVKDRVRTIATQGPDPLLQDVAAQERDDQIAGARQLAEERAAAGDGLGLQSAAQLIRQAQDRLAQTPTRTEGLKATGQRALESMAFQYAAPRYKDFKGFDEAVQDGADQLTLRNIVAAAQSELEGETSLWDRFAHFAGTVILNPIYEIIGQRAVNRAIGTSGVNPFNSLGTAHEFRSFFLSLRPDERVELVKGLMKEEMGFFGQNKEANIELLRKLADMTQGDAGVDTVFNALNFTDAAQIGHLLFNTVRRGVPAKVLNEVAGPDAAAQAVVRDLLTGSKVSGLNDAEQVARLLAIGKHPMDIDPAAFSGMSAAGKEQLRKMWDGLLESTKNKLISSGLTPDEVKQGLADIRARYSSETNPTVHSVEFGEGGELGQKMTVYWQGPDGKAFTSREAAEAWAKAEGKVDYQLVPRNLTEEPRLAAVKQTGSEGLERVDNYVNTLRARGPEQAGASIERMVDEAGREPLTEQLGSIWKQAAQSEKQVHPTAQGLLKVIATQSSNEDERLLAGHLLRIGNERGVEWSRLKVQMHNFGGDAGEYYIRDDLLTVHKKYALDAEILLHELIHAHNAQVLTLVANGKGTQLSRAVREAASDVLDLHNRLNKYFEKKGLRNTEKRTLDFAIPREDPDALARGIDPKRLEEVARKPQELITYGLTDASIRALLGKIQLKDLGYTGKAQTVLSALWDALRRMIGINKKDSALAKLVSAHEKLVGSIDERSRTLISDAYKAGHLSEERVNELMGDSYLSARRKPQEIGKALDKEIAKEEKKLTKVGDAEREAVVARIIKLREAKATLTPKAAPKKEEWLVKEQRLDPISAANVGKFSEEDIRSMPWLAVDPKHAASELAIEERVIGVHAEAKTRHDLTNYLTPYFSKLSKAGKARVKAVLEEGDAFSNGGAAGKEFTYGELRGRGLTDEEAQAYFATRQVRMVSYHLRNAEMVRSLRSEGYKEIEFLGTGEKYAGKVLEEQEAGQALGKMVFDTTSGQSYLVDSQTLASSYAAGKRIVQLKQPVKLGGKMWFNVLVDDTTAKGREIVTALHYRPGEFSRIYSDQYFITMKKMAEVDGRMQEVVETVRTAASSREAKEYVEAHRKAIQLLLEGKGVPGNIDQELDKLIGRYTDPQELKTAVANGDFNGYTGMDFHFTRNKEEYLNSSVNEAISNGRLFTSKRSQKLLSVDRDRRNTLDVFESLQAEITNISRVTNISMWRDNMIRRWMNTFGDMVPNRTGNDVADFFAADGHFTKGSPEAMFAERTHRYIIRQLGVKNAEERFYENTTRMLTEKLFTGNERIEAIGAKIREKGWFGFVRNINFNFNLGMFNPAQLIVQANGATTAMILSPIHGAKAAFTFPLLRMALMSDNPAVWSRLAKMEKLKNLGLSNEQEFAQLVKAVRKAGFLNNMKSTSLWNLEDGALNIFGGYPSKIGKQHTFFFDRGEEFNRLVSFDVARREWIAKNPGKDWTTDVALKQMVVRMDDLTQNMTKANLAFWQKGALSIPFQFAQYNIKLAANVMTSAVKPGRGFSRMEAAQLLVGHVLLYGAAGNGLMWVVNEVLPHELKDKMSVKEKELLAQGVITWAFDSAHEFLTGEGAKVAIGNRLGSFDYWQRIGEAIFKDPGNVFEALLGPTVSSAKRIGVIGDVASLWMRDPDLTGQDVLDGLTQMATEQVATLRNSTKAYLFMQHQGKMLDRQGVALGTLNRNELLWQALGFQPTAAFDLNNLIKSKHDHAVAIDDISKTILQVQKDMLTAMKNGDYKRAEEKRKLLNALFPENAGDFMEVQKRIRDRLYPYETEMQKLLGDYMLKGQTYDKPVVVTEQPRNP